MSHAKHNKHKRTRETLEQEMSLLADEIMKLRRVLEKKQPVRRLVIILHPLEPIIGKEQRKSMNPLDLGKIPLGQRMPVDFVPNEPVDVKSDGSYGSVTILSGDASAQVAPGSTPEKFTVYFNGDGALGKKSAKVAVDGHVGDGDVEVEQEIDWEVISPDATAFTATPRALEPIPVP